MKISSPLLLVIGFLSVLLFSGCVNLMYFDPQYYAFKVKSLQAGEFIYNEALYREIPFTRDGYPKTFSNGYELKTYFKDTKYSNRFKNEYHEIFYCKDSKKHLVYVINSYTYIATGLWLAGDEGRGFHWETSKEMGGLIGLKMKYMEQKDDK